MAEKVKRFYWLKLSRDFLKRHDIKIIKAMPNGKDYIIFYLALLLESIDHEGHLRFSDTIPYDENMLSIVTDTNIDIVKSAIQIFRQLGLMEILDDKTIYMTETQKMLGAETEWAKKKRAYRESIETDKKLLLGHKKDIVRQEIEKEIDIEIDIDNTIESVSSKKPFFKPTIEEIQAYCQERNNNVDAETFYDFYESKGWLVGKNKMKDWKAAIRTWEKSRQENKAFNNQKKESKNPKWYNNYTKEFDKKHKLEESEDEELKKLTKDLFGDRND